MSAMAMKARLNQLATRHGVTVTPAIIPLTDPVQASELIVEGYATTPNPNLDRSQFAAKALTWSDDCADVPLYLKHNETKRVGTIKSLSYDHHGNLKISAVVTDPQAMRMGGFSVGATASEYRLHNESSRDFFCEITKGTLMEVSLTDRPADPRALVQRRFKPGSFDLFLDGLKTYAATQDEFYQLVGSAFSKAAQIVETLAVIVKDTRETKMRLEAPSRRAVTMYIQAGAPSAPKIYGSIPKRPPPMEVEPHRKSEFSQLVGALGSK